jgi:hypothetical protein
MPVAGRFPTIEANCVYYFQVSDLAEESYIYKFNIETFDDDEKPELVSAAMGSNDTLFAYAEIWLMLLWFGALTHRVLSQLFTYPARLQLQLHHGHSSSSEVGKAHLTEKLR